MPSKRYDDARELRTELARVIAAWVKRNDLTNAEASVLLAFTKPEVSRIVNGLVKGSFGTERLLAAWIRIGGLWGFTLTTPDLDEAPLTIGLTSTSRLMQNAVFR
jgi:predicted XRE-type DNA-binding protein